MPPFPELEPSEFSFADLAERINEAFRAVDSSRVRAGLLLIEARARVEASGQLWTAWVAANIKKRTMRDVQRCMKLARAADPAAAIGAERAQARASMAAYRSADSQGAADRTQADATNVCRLDLSGVTARIGKQDIDIASLSPAAQAQLAEALGPSAPEQIDDGCDDLPASPDGEGYWLTPPYLYAELDAEFHFELDPCPHPRREDGLETAWKKSNYLNPPFVAQNGKDGKGPMAWIRKAIKEQDYGNTTVLLLPATAAQLDLLVRAGAEIRTIGKDGRVRWRHTLTGEPMPSPPVTIMFVLRGKQARVMPLWPVWWPYQRKDVADADAAVPLEPVREDRPIVVPLMSRNPAAEPVARSSGQLVCVLGPYRCEHAPLCRPNRRCWEARVASMAEAY